MPETFQTVDEWIDPPILTVDETDQDKLYKLCARYTDYIIKSPNAVFNCNGYIPQQKTELGSDELTETDDVYNYEREKRSDNGTDAEGSGEATFEDSVPSPPFEERIVEESTSPPVVLSPDEEAGADESSIFEEKVVEEHTSPAAVLSPDEADFGVDESPVFEERIVEHTSPPLAFSWDEESPSVPPIEENISAPAAEDVPAVEPAGEESSPTEARTAEEDSVPAVLVPAVLSAPDSADGSDKPAVDEETNEPKEETPDLAGRSAAGTSNAEDEKSLSSSGADNSATGKFISYVYLFDSRIK